MVLRSPINEDRRSYATCFFSSSFFFSHSTLSPGLSTLFHWCTFQHFPGHGDTFRSFPILAFIRKAKADTPGAALPANLSQRNFLGFDFHKTRGLNWKMHCTGGGCISTHKPIPSPAHSSSPPYAPKVFLNLSSCSCSPCFYQTHHNSRSCIFVNVLLLPLILDRHHQRCSEHVHLRVNVSLMEKGLCACSAPSPRSRTQCPTHSRSSANTWWMDDCYPAKHWKCSLGQGDFFFF